MSWFFSLVRYLSFCFRQVHRQFIHLMRFILSNDSINIKFSLKFYHFRHSHFGLSFTILSYQSSMLHSGDFHFVRYQRPCQCEGSIQFRFQFNCINFFFLDFLVSILFVCCAKNLSAYRHS